MSALSEGEPHGPVPRERPFNSPYTSKGHPSTPGPWQDHRRGYSVPRTQGGASTGLAAGAPAGGTRAGVPYLSCISTLRLWRKCPAKARQSTGVSVA